jgi:hypothetical protein
MKYHREQFGRPSGVPDAALQARIDAANEAYIRDVSLALRGLMEAHGNGEQNAEGWVAVLNIMSLSIQRWRSFHETGRERISKVVATDPDLSAVLGLLEK